LIILQATDSKHHEYQGLQVFTLILNLNLFVSRRMMTDYFAVPKHPKELNINGKLTSSNKTNKKTRKNSG